MKHLAAEHVALDLLAREVSVNHEALQSRIRTRFDGATVRGAIERRYDLLLRRVGEFSEWPSARCANLRVDGIKSRDERPAHVVGVLLGDNQVHPVHDTDIARARRVGTRDDRVGDAPDEGALR